MYEWPCAGRSQQTKTGATTVLISLMKPSGQKKLILSGPFTLKPLSRKGLLQSTAICTSTRNQQEGDPISAGITHTQGGGRPSTALTPRLASMQTCRFTVSYIRSKF